MMITSSESKPFLSLIFVNFQSARHLKEALESLFEKESSSSLYEVILVNNDSQEEEKKLLGEIQKKWPWLTVVESGGNRGFGSGANQGAERAQGAVLGFLNPDLLWKDETLPSLAQAFRAEEKLGVAGLQLLTPQGQPERWSSGSEPTLFRTLLNNVWPSQEKNDKSTAIRQTDWVSGGALFVRRNLFQSIQGFDERFFLYFEDVDLCQRARERGWAVKLFSSLSVFHKGGKSHSSEKEQKKLFYQSQDRYFRKHTSPISYLLLRIFRFFRHGL